MYFDLQTIIDRPTKLMYTYICMYVLTFTLSTLKRLKLLKGFGSILKYHHCNLKPRIRLHCWNGKLSFSTQLSLLSLFVENVVNVGNVANLPGFVFAETVTDPDSDSDY